MADTQRPSLNTLQIKPWRKWLSEPQSRQYRAVGLRFLITAGYALVVVGLALALTGFAPLDRPLLTTLIFFVAALGLSPVRDLLLMRLDTALLRGVRTFAGQLENLRAALDANKDDLNGILQATRSSVEHTLAPLHATVYLYDARLGQYCAAPGADGRAGSDIRFPADGALVKALSQHANAVFFPRLQQLPATLLSDEARMRLLEAYVYVPLAGTQQLTGWIALGARASGASYNPRDLDFLTAVGEQVSPVIERAQVNARMENRAREMTMFSRLAQGINVTRSFDDILELIYAQTSQVIPLQDLDLFLLTDETNTLLPVFCVESDERMIARENVPLPPDPTLEQEVIRGRKPILVEDYQRESQKRGLPALKSGAFAWIGVPLNAGAETIGMLAVSSRDPSFVYAPEQMTLLQSIADQAAGAIVKARLLNEAERRARQLASLNEVTRQLTSTLSLEPLLQTILNSAVDILNCEAGSLLMVSEPDGEMVFEVVVSPVAKDLLKTRLPAGSGLAGKAVKERRSILVNNVQQSQEWSPDTDHQTGYITRSLIVTPLEIKDTVIGVIEVINRKDRMLFSKDDETLLSAFAAQASVAIENARLYTNTDKALEARVHELSVMQRIDRELNASLETGRAFDITLEWAMRQSGAQAGLIAMTQEDGLRVMASQGYTRELEGNSGGLLPADLPGMRDVLQSGIPVSACPVVEGGALLTDAHSHAVLAIQREEQVAGILLLESVEAQPVSEETLAFLARLADHASSAISNAQLYAAVQSANLAKSEFVSFVSHELKNPMTSVKGFTELLASGVVGPINEAQANFLATIRSNIDRMNTLVSDLNDVSKIEAGRLRLDYKAFALADLVEEVTRSTRRQLEEKEQTLTVEGLDALPNLWADRTRVVQVLVNLVSNANKYTDKAGQIWLGAEACENQWDEKGARQVVHIWVRDNGIGISEADQVKIFQKFFRSDDPKTREATGTGLGLNITRSLVEMQGGRIWFESVFREGTTFHFTVPISE